MLVYTLANSVYLIPLISNNALPRAYLRIYQLTCRRRRRHARKRHGIIDTLFIITNACTRASRVLTFSLLMVVCRTLTQRRQTHTFVNYIVVITITQKSMIAMSGTYDIVAVPRTGRTANNAHGTRLMSDAELPPQTAT